MCYHLYSKARSEAFIPFQIPELQRTPLEELCLQASLLSNSEPRLSLLVLTHHVFACAVCLCRWQLCTEKDKIVQVKLLQGEHVGSIRIEDFLALALEAPSSQAVTQVHGTALFHPD